MNDPNKIAESHSTAWQKPTYRTIDEALVITHNATCVAYKPDQVWGDGNQVVASYICPHVNQRKERHCEHPFDEGPTLLSQ